MKFIGIDLAWTYKNETGICVIDESGKVEYLASKVFSDADIVALVKSYGHEPLGISVDAPLMVQNESGSRSAERELMRARIHGHKISLFVANRGFLTRTFGQIRGETLMHLIMAENPTLRLAQTNTTGENTILETFPSAICCGLFPEIYPVKYKIKGKMKYEETKFQMERILKRIRAIEEVEEHVDGIVSKLGLDEMTLDKGIHKHIEDMVDAFLCAYGMYAIHKGVARAVTFGSIVEGCITVPIAEAPLPLSLGRLRIADATYRLGRVTEADMSKMLDLCRSCDAYYALDIGRQPQEEDAVEILHELPPGKHLCDKYVIGMFDAENVLIGLMDIVRGYPEEETWMLGLLLIHSQERGKGLGKAFYQEVASWVKSEKGKKIRIGVYEDNDTGLEFWKSMGFEEIKRVELERSSGRMKSVIVMTCNLL